MSTDKRLSVLVVDDSVHIVEFISELLRRQGHSVVTARSGREAEAILDAVAVDVLITDILMPDGDGIELLNRMRRAGKNISRIVAISGGGRYVDSDNCLSIAAGAGAHAVLRKPFTDVELFAALQPAATA
ncbi:MAG: response regulator [Candidatus Didemnitutus sp.]|nr:response regulator [Candidatus Didemnitutus sp.]